MQTLIQQISRLLLAKNWRLVVAESATGGLLGHTITQFPGSSAYFWGGVIAYANDLKVGLLNVNRDSINHWGAVSSQVALEMVKGVCTVTQTEVGISVTGIAGPGGATALKPVGLFYIAVAVPQELRCWRHIFSGSRINNNRRAVKSALEHLLSIL
ncbi:MAG: CinA family protein [Anaerolineae bacterium]|nr:CinA family protein [Anaerolineae bacterium]